VYERLILHYSVTCQSSSASNHKMFLCLPETVLGKEAVNATLPVGVVMCRAIRDYYQRFGYKVNFMTSHEVEWYIVVIYVTYFSCIANQKLQNACISFTMLCACNNFTTAEIILVKINIGTFYGNMSVCARFCWN